MTSEVKIFGGTASHGLAEKIAQSYGKSISKIKVSRFSDGEICPYIQESVRGSYVFFVQSSFSPSDNLMELLFMIDAAKRASAQYITAIIPYYGYARQDRKDKSRVPITAKLIANLLTTAGADRVMTMDLHAPQIQGFFDIPVDHLYGSAIFIPYIRTLGLKNLMFASPDAGSANRARAFAKHFKKNIVICDKHRERANRIVSMTVIGDVKGQDIILVDDIVDTANTLCKAAEAIMAKGANSVRAFCTHPVLSRGAYELIANSVLEELVVCDTIPVQQSIDKIKVLSVAELFATAVHHVIEHKSISSLFAVEQ